MFVLARRMYPYLHLFTFVYALVSSKDMTERVSLHVARVSDKNSRVTSTYVNT